MTENVETASVCHQYLADGGEMGELIRSFKWSDTSLGSPETWPKSLLTTINILLNSKFPMLLWWGPDLIQFYNDAYRPIFDINDRHPAALGQRGEDCWPEIWPVIKPMIDKVILTGEATWNENQLIPMFRNNQLEDVYWTSSCSKVTDDQGNLGGVLSICTETTGRIKSYRQIKDAKRELEFAIESAELGTWDLDPIANKFISNDRLKNWFGLPMIDEIDLDYALSAVIEQDRDRVIESIQMALQRGADGNYSIIYTIKNLQNGVPRIVSAKGKAVFNDHGDAYRFSGILQDVTDEYQLQQRKDEFISVASHELKTPITSLNASVQILQRLIKTDPSSEKVQLFIDKANNNLNKLIHLLDDLLNVTKIQQGQLALNKTMFNLAEMINDCCEHVRMYDNHEMTITGDKELMVFADYRRLDQVVVNLINNAIKYAPQSKKIDISIGHDDNMVTIAVRDYGIGIHPDKLPHLFDRYYRVDALGHQFSGLGLGLYISAEIVNRHGGKIGVESTRGEGSEFWFTIPING